jgi:predicted transposase YbfD/YdcC
MIGQKRNDLKTTSFERRYYISNPNISGKAFVRCIRGHWAIENNLHWMMDVQFHEDQSLIRTGLAPEYLCLSQNRADAPEE